MSLDVYLEKMQSTVIHSQNITHNLGPMARAAGIYQALWRPEELKNWTGKAGQLIPLLEKGLAKLKKAPAKYKKLNAPNGWGSYTNFVPFVERYLTACRENPDADVKVSRQL